MEKTKRFVTIKAYCDMTGLSWATVNNMCKSGQLNYIMTESGLRRIDTKADGNPDNAVLLEKLDSVEKKLTALCRQLNTVV